MYQVKQLPLTHKIIWVSVFALSMGFLEAAVVIYLREIYYPEGFAFPLKPISGIIAITEILREAATVAMLVALGIVTGRNISERFAWFIFSFAVWDIFYYVFLKLILNWPENFLTWDILFLIPVTWVGPVIAPVLLSAIMILLAVLILTFQNKSEQKIFISAIEWLFLVIGSLVVIISFTEDYLTYIFKHFSPAEVLSVSNRDALLSLSVKYIPNHFNWLIFFAGTLLILAGVTTFLLRNIRSLRSEMKFKTN